MTHLFNKDLLLSLVLPCASRRSIFFFLRFAIRQGWVYQVKKVALLLFGCGDEEFSSILPGQLQLFCKLIREIDRQKSLPGDDLRELSIVDFQAFCEGSQRVAPVFVFSQLKLLF